MYVEAPLIFAAHQPNFLPYPGFWAKMDRADVFGLMPKAQFTKGDYQNRVKIGKDDNARWLSLPVTREFGCSIDQVRLAENCKLKKIVGPIRDTYSKYPFWKDYGDAICDLFLITGSRLYDVNRLYIIQLQTFLGIRKPLKQMPANTDNPSGDLARWAVNNECDTYLSGPGAKAYLNEEVFKDYNVKLIYTDTRIKEGFRTVSILTALFEYGPNWRAVLS